MALADFQTLTTALHRDDTGKITTGDRDIAIASAVQRYSRDRPRLKSQDVIAAAANLIALPAAWETDFSAVRAIEYPIGSVPPDFLAQDRYALHLQTDGTYQIMLLDAVNIGEGLRITYTIRHQVDGSGDTVPAHEREAVCCWAAALLLDQLAALFSGDSNSTIQADSVDHGGKSREYAARARALRTRYFDELGLTPKKNAAAGVEVNLNTDDSRGQDRLTHPRRYR